MSGLTPKADVRRTGQPVRFVPRADINPGWAFRAAMQFQTCITDLTIGDVEDRRIAFRVGINIGDVIVEPHDIFGDGVNIAARLESIAEPGSICISSSAYDYVRGKVGVEFAD